MRQQMQSVRQESPVTAGLVRPVLISAVFFMVVTGLLYPLGTTGVSRMLFHRQAQGSIITEHGADVGSAIIGQWFTEPKYFHPRPSVTTGTDPNDSSKTVDQPYNAANTSGSNLGSTSKKLVDAVTGRVEAYRKENGLGPTDPVPVDAVTASGSGLDPDISVANARIQAKRVAAARGIPEQQVPPDAKILIGAKAVGPSMYCFVEDNGPGLPPGDPEQFFKPFVRGQKESAISGVGLGLALCRSIIAAHGGTIRAEAAKPAGTRFEIRVPLGSPPGIEEEDAA
jgi:K+-transporting ATPase ATPase C chain